MMFEDKILGKGHRIPDLDLFPIKARPRPRPRPRPRDMTRTAYKSTTKPRCRRTSWKEKAMSMLKNWKHKDAQTKATVLLNRFGKPSTVGKDRLGWSNIRPYYRLWIIDESIPHSFPVQHRDFLYTSYRIKVPKDMVGKFAYVTGSIMIDGLRNIVTARCQKLVKNAVTIGFVHDAVKGKINPTKQEYARRILGNIKPKKFPSYGL